MLGETAGFSGFSLAVGALARGDPDERPEIRFNRVEVPGSAAGRAESYRGFVPLLVHSGRLPPTQRAEQPALWQAPC
jgi:hypothetical protein